MTGRAPIIPTPPAAARRYGARSLAAFLAAFLALPGVLAAQAAAPSLVVRRTATDSVVLSAARLAALPHQEVRATDHGMTNVFSGVPLAAVLRAAGVSLDSLRGPRLADVLLAEAADGYRVALSLGELAPDVGRGAAYLADRRDGKPLGAAEGPLRLVLPGDGRGARWVRQLRTLSIVRVAPPRDTVPNAATSALPSVAPTPNCSGCAEWNVPHAPVRLFANTWYVGTNGLSAILVTSSAGHVLLDGGLPESAPLIAANVRAAGFRVEDVRLILNSHDHYDHAGGIAYLQRLSGASVAARAPSATVLAQGRSDSTDPQYGVLASFTPVPNVRTVAAGETVRVGPLALTAHATAGHTPGGTTWTWRSCDGPRCLDFVYADSQTPVSADGFLYSRSTTYPAGVEDFRRGADLLERLSCDVLVTPHPSASGLWERVAARDSGRVSALVNRDACRRYAATARQALARRLAEEQAKR